MKIHAFVVNTRQHVRSYLRRFSSPKKQTVYHFVLPQDLESLHLCLPKVKASEGRLADQGQGVWINADILPGPNRRDQACPISAEEFVMAVRQCAGVPLSF